MPRTETITHTLFQFDELNDHAKEKAREWFRQFVFTESHDWECTHEDAARVADLLGIDLRQRAAKLMGGGTRNEPAIYFSGFSSQGDGACFEGTWTWRACSKAIRDYAPTDTTLHAIADILTNLPHGEAWSASIKRSGRYYHSGCMNISVEFDDAWLQQEQNDDTAELSQAEFTAGEDTIIQAMRDFADWMYSQLEKEYEYQISDESVDDNIRANKYEFTGTGTLA